MSIKLGIDGITEQDIANYLTNNPAFFERHAQLLASIELTSPHGTRAVSLQERQMQMLRDKNKALEQRIMEMVRHAHENLTLAKQLDGWVTDLLRTQSLSRLKEVLPAQLQSHFAIEQAALRVWSGTWPSGSKDVSEDLQLFAASLGKPYCGANAGFEACTWLAQPEKIASVAMIPLREPGAELAFGLLVLGSSRIERYSPDMGSEFLVRVGEIASAALSRMTI